MNFFGNIIMKQIHAKQNQIENVFLFSFQRMSRITQIKRMLHQRLIGMICMFLMLTERNEKY